MQDTNSRSRGAISVNDFAVWAGIGRTTAWKEIKEGRLRAVKISARTVIITDDAHAWLTSRPAVGSYSQNFS